MITKLRKIFNGWNLFYYDKKQMKSKLIVIWHWYKKQTHWVRNYHNIDSNKYQQILFRLNLYKVTANKQIYFDENKEKLHIEKYAFNREYLLVLVFPTAIKTKASTNKIIAE